MSITLRELPVISDIWRVVKEGQSFWDNLKNLKNKCLLVVILSDRGLKYV